MMAISKTDRFFNLGKIQHQQYQQALANEQHIRQMVESMTAAITQVRGYQRDYQKDLKTLQDGTTNSVKIVGTRKFLQQLMQMEVDQLGQCQGLTQKLQQAQAHTLLMLQKSRMTEKLTARAQAEQLAANNVLDAKQMDAVAAQMYTRG
jgi:flagellar biosynthesis chaperone FliJ